MLSHAVSRVSLYLLDYAALDLATSSDYIIVSRLLQYPYWPTSTMNQFYKLTLKLGSPVRPRPMDSVTNGRQFRRLS
jgi:hypothetical protein